ncbi:Ribosomal protein [Salix suchowensis]|nr:Ribosomal protein [Salix suchowensis]
MALLASCWLILESFVIPDGFLKWVYLSFYIHPIFLFVCQIYLWLKLLQKWFLVAISYLSYGTSNNEDAEEIESFEPLKSFKNHAVISFSSSSIAPLPCQLQVFKLNKTWSTEEKDSGGDAIPCKDDNTEQQNFFVGEDESMIKGHLSTISFSSRFSMTDESLNDDRSSVSSSHSSASGDLDMKQYSPLIDSSNPLAVEREFITDRSREEDSQDPFYKKYTERMRWFDVLNHERTSEISVILNRQAGNIPGSIFESMKLPADMSVPKMERRLWKSLESDFELVYVAQSCLSWEALHHQYRKVEALASSSSQNGVFYDDVAGEFQKFQVLLERFMEDEMCESGKRNWNYVRARFSLRSLLQVPVVSENEEIKREAIHVKEVMEAIERSILAYWEFIKTDGRKTWRKSIMRSSLWTWPTVENPRDLWLQLTSPESSKGRWLRRAVEPTLEESQKKEMLFTMIDLKLVSRVLQMSVLSTSQLKWCQEKLDDIAFTEGKIARACTGGPLFPP